MNRHFVAGLILGVIIATIWAGLNRTPPPKGAKTSKVWDTKDLNRFREQKAAGQ